MSFTEIVSTKYGRMLVHAHDTGQTNALRAGHALAWKEIELLKPHLEKTNGEGVFLDIGANVGAFSFALRPFCKKVYAFEAQRIIFYMLAGSVALNGWENVFCYHAAIADGDFVSIPIPCFDYNKPLSTGSIEFGRPQQEWIGQQPSTSVESVSCTTIDKFSFPRVDVMKIDVEGMEPEVLKGAAHTIEQCRPVILMEHAKCGAPVLEEWLQKNEYNYENLGMDFFCLPR